MGSNCSLSAPGRFGLKGTPACLKMLEATEAPGLLEVVAGAGLLEVPPATSAAAAAASLVGHAAPGWSKQPWSLHHDV
jgi:hypothetical protein